jgi:hypothetical protein
MEGSRSAEGTAKATSPLVLAAVKRPYDESLTPTGAPETPAVPSKCGDSWLSKNNRAMASASAVYGGGSVHGHVITVGEDSPPDVIEIPRDENTDPTMSGRRPGTRKRYEFT